MGFGRTDVSSLSRVPSPPARITAFIEPAPSAIEQTNQPSAPARRIDPAPLTRPLHIVHCPTLTHPCVCARAANQARAMPMTRCGQHLRGTAQVVNPLPRFPEEGPEPLDTDPAGLLPEDRRGVSLGATAFDVP